MGFEDIKTDGLLIEELKEETKKYNKLYFGEGMVLPGDPVKKGQLEKYNEAKKKYLEQQFGEVKSYFLSLGWDYTEKGGVHNFRANVDVYVAYKYGEVCYVEFKKEDIRKSYDIKVDSDFMENPYYAPDTTSRGWGSNRYAPKGGEATRPEMIKERLDEIKAVIKNNDDLKGNYNFRIVADKNADNSYRYDSETNWVLYTSVMDIINEISKEYF